METKFNFNSSVCTSIEQSERLLALGLKKETADMALHFSYVDCEGNAYYSAYPIGHQCTAIPAWSLHRLILLCKYNDDDFGTLIPREGTYDYLIESIAYRIKEGYFNKEYLV